MATPISLDWFRARLTMRGEDPTREAALAKLQLCFPGHKMPAIVWKHYLDRETANLHRHPEAHNTMNDLVKELCKAAIHNTRSKAQIVYDAEQLMYAGKITPDDLRTVENYVENTHHINDTIRP